MHADRHHTKRTCIPNLEAPKHFSTHLLQQIFQQLFFYFNSFSLSLCVWHTIIWFSLPCDILQNSRTTMLRVLFESF